MNALKSKTEYMLKQNRPYSRKKCLHVVLRSKYSQLRVKENRKIIATLLLRYSTRFKVRIYQNSLNSNHIHLICFAQEKHQIQNFLRVFAGQVAQQITQRRKGAKLTVNRHPNPFRLVNEC